MNLIEYAKEYRDLGFVVLPIKADKSPVTIPSFDYNSWRMEVEEQTDEFLESIFSMDHYGIAIGIPEGMEVIDIDEKYNLDSDPLVDKMFDKIDQEGGDMNHFTCIVATPSGGYHVIYKAPNAEGNKKLANRKATEAELAKGDSKVKVLFETRGHGGYIAAYPTPGYVFINGNYSTIPEIHSAYRDGVIQICKSFSQVEQKEKFEIKEKDLNRVSAWQEFNDSKDDHDMMILLRNHGWQLHSTKTGRDGENRHYMTRPGKNVRAGYSADIHIGKKLFKAHTNRTEFDPDEAYTYFEVWVILERNGDYAAAAKELYGKGFGDRYEGDLNSEQSFDNVDFERQLKIDKTASVLDNLSNCQIDWENPPAPMEPRMWYKHVDGTNYKVCGYHNLFGLNGESGAGKSTLLEVIISAALSGGTHCGWKVDIEGKDVVLFDTEQERSKVFYGMRNIAKAVGMESRNKLKVYSQAAANSSKERLEQFKAFVELTDMSSVGMVVVDGIVDYCNDFNNPIESRELSEYLRKTCVEHEIILIFVLHTNTGYNKMRGHLGTMMDQKSDIIVNCKIDEYGTIVTPRCYKGRPFGRFPKKNEISAITRGHNFVPVLADTVVTKNDDDGLDF